MIRYALYTRKSHDDTDVTEKSLTDQLKVWRDLATERGYTIHQEYQESKSAKDPGVRPLFKEMIGRIQKGEINGILVWHVNRLARNMTEGGLLADLLINGKIKEIRTPNEVFQQQDNILPLVLQQATATQNNRDHAEAVLRGVTSRFADGGWTHRAPVGYLNRRDPNNARRGLVISDPERFEKLRLAWEMLLTGAHSVEEVIDTLNSRWGFRTRQTKKRGGGPLTRSHGYKMFTDIFYAGYLERQGQIQKGQHKPLVSIKEYHHAQEILQQRGKARSTRSGQSQSHTQREKHQFPFTGLIRCGYCGQQVTAGLLRKNGRQYTYYRCSDSYKRCTQRGISEAKIDAQVIALLESVTVDEQLCQVALENITRWLGEKSQSSEDSYQQLHRNLENIESQFNNLLTLRLREVISDDEIYKKKQNELAQERTQLRLAIQEAEEEMEHMRQTAKNGYTYLAFARDHYLLGDVQTKKELARAMGIEYVLHGNELSITINPLLKEFVRFTDQIIVSLEPELDGSQSRYRASFSSRKSFGRTAGTLFEPVASLHLLLRETHFAGFTLHGLNLRSS